MGRGGVQAVHLATGLAESTIRIGQGELFAGIDPAEEELRPTPIRKEGRAEKQQVRDPQLLAALEALVEPTRGATRCPRCAGPARAPGSWPRSLTRQGHRVSHQTVAELLARAGLQPAGQPQDAGGRPPSGPQRPVSSTSTQQVKAFQRRGPAGDLGGHQEEGIGRATSRTPGREWRPAGPAEAGRSARLSRTSNWARRSPTASTTWPANEGWVSVGHRPRHRRVRGGEHPALVAGDGSRVYPRGRGAADHGRRRRQQRQSHPAVEGGAAGAGRRTRA